MNLVIFLSLFRGVPMKKISLILTFLFLSLTFVSCGGSSGGGGGGQERQEEKSIFDKWVDDEFGTVDFTGYEFDTPSELNISYGSGEICSCVLTISGSESSGRIDVTSCFYIGGGSGDPECFSNNGSYPYTKEEEILRICFAPNDCVDFR